MPHGTRGSENAYYQTTYFTDVKPVNYLDLSLIKNRKTTAIFERHSYYPMDYFFFSVDGVQYFGRKTLSSLYVSGKQHIKKCNQITATMMIGLILRTQTTEKGILIFYKPLQNPEKVFLFNELKINPKMDIHFPFPVLDKAFKEHVQPVDAWDPNEDMADSLNGGEEHIRKYTIEFLSQFDLDGKIIYDPACSTGKFLATIKTAYPKTKVIGQDINEQMIQFAKKENNIDKLHVGSAQYPCVSKESADFIFLRFLNLAVLSSEAALKLFCKLANCCKKDGIMVIFGYTPVLLSAEIYEILNLDVKQTIAYSKDNDSVFQFYVLQKKGPTPQLRYENFSLYNISTAQPSLFNSNPPRNIEKENEINFQIPKSKL